jgi:hypothetical protein
VIDADSALRTKIPEFVQRGDFGLAWGPKSDGSYERLFFKESLPAGEIEFTSDVFLLRRKRAESLKTSPPSPATPAEVGSQVDAAPERTVTDVAKTLEIVRLAVTGSLPAEVWNRVGQKLLPKLRVAGAVEISIDLSVEVPGRVANALSAEVLEILREIGLEGRLNVRIDG